MATEARLKDPTAATDACYRPIYRSHGKLAGKDEAGLAQGAPWQVSLEQEAILTRLRDLTRGYGRGS